MTHQSPKTEGNYLYQDQADGSRLFAKQVVLPDNAPEWSECTAEERDQWQTQWDAAHPQEEQQEEQPTDAEPVQE